MLYKKQRPGTASLTLLLTGYRYGNNDHNAQVILSP